MGITNVTQTEWLISWWQQVFKDANKYEILKFAATITCDNPEPAKKYLEVLRKQFNRRYEQYTIGEKCFLCEDIWKQYPTRYLIRHHILALSKGGCNRRVNIVALCTKCHCYMHPWLFKDLAENQETETKPKTKTFKTKCCSYDFKESKLPFAWHSEQESLICNICSHKYIPIGK